jgi:hypothetical protein
MAASSQISQNKRGKDEYLNGGLALPDGKRTNTGRLVHDCDLMAVLEKIDNPEEIHSVNQLEDERLSEVTKSLEDELELKGQEDEVETVDVNGKGSTEMVSIKQGEITEGKSETTSVSDTGEMHSEGNLTYYDDVCAEFDFFVDDIIPDELGIFMQNHVDGDSVPDIMYSDAVHGYVQTGGVFYGSLWEDDIWQFNEHPVIQNDFLWPQQEEFGINGAEFHDFGTRSSDL